MAAGKKVMELLFRVKSKEAKKDIKEVGDGLSNVGKKGKIAQGGLNLMGKGFKGIGVAIKAAGIGLFVGLLSQLTGLFSQNQKTADTFQRIMIKLQPVMDAVGKVIELLAAGLEKMVDWITQAIGWIGDLIGVSNSFGDSVNASADALVNQRKKVQLLEAELGLLQLQYQREAELMRQIRDDESLSIQERIDANYELGKVLEEQLQRERDIASESLYLAELELSRNKNNVELQVALLDAKTKLAEIDERITGQRSEQLTNLNSLEREREAQQKEAASKREEQLKKEAEMLQSLIDLQNEDIKVTKEKFRTINEQFDNAEEQNQKQIDEINRKMKAELEALDLTVKNAKVNINAQNEQTEAYKLDIEEKNKEDEKRQKKILENVKADLKLFQRTANEKGIMTYRNEEGLVDQQKSFENLRKNSTIKSLDDLLKLQKDFEEENAKHRESMRTSASSDYFIDAVIEDIDNVEREFNEYVQKISKDLESEAGIYNDITQKQLETSEQSANASLQIIETSADKRLEIEQKYAKEIEDTKKSLDDTTLTLQQQADQELFLHFETAQEKELRLATEKYDKLLGLALNNAEQTKLLEEEKEEALAEIREREGKEMLQKNLDFFKKLRDQKKKQDDIDLKKDEAIKDMKIKTAIAAFNVGESLAKEGTATAKALASASTIISTYAGASQVFDDPLMPTPLKFINAGLIIATGLKNLAEINKTKVPGGKGGGGGAISDTTTGSADMGGDVPSLPTFGDAGSDMPPVQAFVVETDISNAQALQSELDLQSTL
tara:strand:- start:159 stop:2501 length:2343 start_codon:yes stop_codon:yes gene_type:complete